MKTVFTAPEMVESVLRKLGLWERYLIENGMYSWEVYEQEKKKIAQESKTPSEYERRITALCKRLGI